MAAQIFSAILVIIVGVGGCVAYFWGANKLLDLIFPARGVSGGTAVDNLRRQGLIRPW
ncbi:MAG: alpha-glucoside ABC transporter permease, partial [Rhizobiaceae bacterium]